jgi:hypothetical protein
LASKALNKPIQKDLPNESNLFDSEVHRFASKREPLFFLSFSLYAELEMEKAYSPALKSTHP